VTDRSKRATIYDVAREAGLAPSTVSNALTGKAGVSPKSRARILAAVEKLDYRALPLARALRSRRSYAIGVLIADVANPSFPDFVRGIEDVAMRERCTLLLGNTDGREDVQLAHMDALLTRGVDGIVLISQHTASNEARRMMQAGPPCVLVQRRSPPFTEDYVGSDNRSGILAAVRHLVEFGHSRIGFVRGPVESSTAAERLSVFREAVAQFGLDADAGLVYPGDYTTESGFHAATMMLQAPRPPSAIIASNDMNALGIIEAAHQLGVRIPGDLSVVGFDDIALASLGRIDLTTIRLPKREMGKAAAELLMRRINAEEGEPPQEIIFPTRLVIRGSTGPASRPSHSDSTSS
jgi:LacI family transcriptional regulator